MGPMRGRKPVRPLTEIADAAVQVFTDRGFRPAGISDVAAVLGLSHGALYTYADSKQALLSLALRRVIRPGDVEGLTIPVTVEPPRETAALLEAWWSREMQPPILTTVDRSTRRSAHEEFGQTIDALYDLVSRNRRALALVSRCAADLPDLAQWHFVEHRRTTLARLADYLRQRIDAGLLPPVPDVPTAARFIVETITWFAMHRHGDPDSATLDDDTCRRTVHHLLLAAFVRTAADVPDGVV